MKTHTKVPKDFEVQPLKPGENPPGKCTCGTCGLSWDDSISTGWTPVPSGRCPFEYFHVYPKEPKPRAKTGRIPPVRSLVRAYQQSHREADEEERQAKEMLETAKQKRLYWVKAILEPLAPSLCQDLTRRTGKRWEWSLLGPFGICSSVSIHFSRITKRKKKDEFSSRNLKSITFVPRDLDGETPLAIRDERKNNGSFGPNTIGAMNGMNHPEVIVPLDADIAWFRKWIR